MRYLLIGIFLSIIVLSIAQPLVKAISRISFCGFPTLKERIISIEETKMNDPSLISYSSDLIRSKLLSEPFKIIKDYPLFGCGLNTYSKVVKDYKNFEFGEQYPHNSFLQKTAETGLLGLFAFLLVLFSFFNNTLVLGLLSGISAFLLHGFFESNLYALQLVVLFWFMLGLTMAVINLEKPSLV
jgi:O-antigen ligase